MINGVGQNAAAASLARAGVYPRVKLASNAGESSVQQTETLGAAKRKADTVVQVGFGDNTLSTIGAALRTIGGGLESARSSVPTLEEIQAQQMVERTQDRLTMTQRLTTQQATPQAENTGETMQVTTATKKDSQTPLIVSQTTTTEKPLRVPSTGNETFALYSRRSETLPDSSETTVTPKLDIKA